MTTGKQKSQFAAIQTLLCPLSIASASRLRHAFSTKCRTYRSQLDCSSSVQELATLEKEIPSPPLFALLRDVSRGFGIKDERSGGRMASCVDAWTDRARLKTEHAFLQTLHAGRPEPCNILFSRPLSLLELTTAFASQ